MTDKKKAEAPSAEDSLATKHLQQIAKCLAYLVVHMGDLKDKPNRDLIPILANLGFDRNAIASVLQTTPDTVSVRLSQLKAASKGKKNKKATSEEATVLREKAE